MKWRSHQILTPPSEDEIAEMEPEELMDIHRIYHEAIENADKDPFRYGFRLPHWGKAEEQLSEVTEIVALGGNRCLAGDQEVFDPIAGKHFQVKDISSSFHVWSWDEGSCSFVIALACKPFKKEKQEAMLHFEFSDGTKISCTANHQFFCYHRGWIPAISIAFEGSKLVSPDAMELFVVSFSADNYIQDVWDFHVPIYNNYFIGGVLSHNSGKTQWGAFSIVRAAVENPNSEIFCFAQTSEVSIRQQQSAVYDWLPAELKTKQTSAGAYISYTKKNGFTDGSLILPNGSQIIFKTYSQYQNNPTILEGAELGSRSPVWHNIGVWLDEYLLGPELINTLRFRLATRDAKMLVTFTPIDGWTEVIKEYLDSATTIESRPAELLKGELVPYIQRSKKRNASIHYFHSQDNPFGGYERIKEALEGRTREEILIRAYGVPVKSQATKFPKFNTAVNVIPKDQIPTKNVTRYQIIDPAGAKNWFMCWVAVDETGTYYVYREWPSVEYGDWAEWKSGKWIPGEAAKGLGYGIRDYVELIQNYEEDEEIFDRLIDPRLGAARYQASDGASSIIEDLGEMEIICNPAPGLEIEEGLQALLSKMSYDTSKPLDSVNRPHFYISQDCENIIRALAEYTGDQGLKEAWKDPIDVLRYAAIADLDHVDSKKSQVTIQGNGGY